jgi:hypothetical protein
MKNLLNCLLLVVMAEGCTAQSGKVKSSASLPPGYYTGRELFNQVFVKVEQGTVIADHIFIEKFPRDLLTDTLVPQKDQSEWKGKWTSLYTKGGRWYISTKQPFFASTIRIKVNEGYYKEQINKKKNAALLEKERFNYQQKSADKGGSQAYFDSLKNQYGLDEKVNVLTHADFLKVYEQFRIALTKNK